MSYLIWLWCRDVFLMLTYAKLLAAVLSSVFSLSLLLCVCVYIYTHNLCMSVQPLVHHHQLYWYLPEARNGSR